MAGTPPGMTENRNGPLKILYTEAARAYWGQERYVHRLMREMRRQGHAVEALCQPGAKLCSILEQDGFPVHTASMKGPWQFWSGLWPLSRWIRRRGFDVVNTNSRKDTIHAGAAARLAGVPLVVRTRHLAKPLHSLIAYNRFPHRVIAASHFVRNMIIEKGMAAEHVAVVYPATDFADPLPKQTLRTELAVSEDAILVGTISALRKDKGIGELIAAMAPILSARNDVRLVIIGGGELQADLENQVNEAGLASQVDFLGERHDIQKLIGDLSIFASATHVEASGTVFVEAAAAGLPTVGYDTTGVPEMVRAGESSLLVPLGDVPALRAALLRLVDDAELRQDMGRAGHQFVVTERRFTLDTFQKSTERIYRHWLEQRKP